MILCLFLFTWVEGWKTGWKTCDTTEGAICLWSLYFDGVDQVQVEDDNSLDLDSAITIETWINTYDYTISQRILSKRNGPAINYTMTLENGYLRFLFINGVVREILDNTTQLSDSTWYHVAATYDMDTMRLYVNGSEVMKKADSLVMIPNNNFISIGWRSDNGGNGFKGLIDATRVYSRVLGPTEILWNYSHYCQIYSTDLICLQLPMEEGVGDSTLDYSGYDNHGILGKLVPANKPDWTADTPY